MNSTQQTIQTAFAAMLALLFGFSLTLVSCKERTPVIIDKPDTVGEKIEDKINDGLDRRPNEKARDAVEKIEDSAQEAKEKVEDSLEN